MRKVGFNSLVQSIGTMVDGSVKITLVTSKELSDTDAAALLGLRRTEGYTVIASEELQEKDLVGMEPDPFKVPKSKSNSQNTRNHLYILWGFAGGNKTFDQYYDEYCNRQCELIREKIKEYEGKLNGED